VSQKTGKGNMKRQSAYFKVFARPCFTGNSRKYNLPYNQNREINRNTNLYNIANIEHHKLYWFFFKESKINSEMVPIQEPDLLVNKEYPLYFLHSGKYQSLET
jgi:hypothetical protein